MEFVEAWQTVVAVVAWQLIADVVEARMKQIAELNSNDFAEGQMVQLTGLLLFVSVECLIGLIEDWMSFALEVVEKIVMVLFATEIAAAVAAAAAEHAVEIAAVSA